MSLFVTLSNIYPINVIYNTLFYIVKLRKNGTDSRKNDLLQALIDASLTDERLRELADERGEMTTILKGNDIRKLNVKKSLVLSEFDVISNCFTILFGGYLTTSPTLSCATHFLVNNPEIQERVRKEIIDLYEREGELAYNTLSNLEYMECVLNETMRLHPPLINSTARICLSDYNYKDITIPKGATVVMCTHFLHYDPDYWNEPDKFDPMRFNADNKHKINVCSWQPFGDGPRNCLGMRFAYLTMKLILAKLLLQYKLEAVPNKEGTLKTKFKLGTMVPENGVYVKAVAI